MSSGNCRVFGAFHTGAGMSFLSSLAWSKRASKDHASDHWNYIFNPLWGSVKRCILHYFRFDAPVCCVNIASYVDIVYCILYFYLFIFDKWIFHRQSACRYQRIYQNYQWDIRGCIGDQMWAIHLIWSLQTRYYQEQKNRHSIKTKHTQLGSNIAHGLFPLVIVKWGNALLIRPSSSSFNTWVWFFEGSAFCWDSFWGPDLGNRGSRKKNKKLKKWRLI